MLQVHEPVRAGADWVAAAEVEHVLTLAPASEDQIRPLGHPIAPILDEGPGSEGPVGRDLIELGGEGLRLVAGEPAGDTRSIPPTVRRSAENSSPASCW